MSDLADNLVSTLKLFGFEDDEAKVYIKIYEKSSSTPLEISRLTGMPRTRVYRVLERLVQRGFVKEEVRGYGTKYSAQDFSKFDILLREKEQEFNKLKNSAPALYEQLDALNIQHNGEYKIQHYRGFEGLKQVTWNSTKAIELLRIYEIELMHSFLDYDFSEKVRYEFGIKKDLKVRQLTNKKEFSDYTKVKEHIDQLEVRYINTEKLAINVEILIYNDIYCIYEYRNDDVFIVEIQNQKLAEMQKQLFDLIWSSSKKMKKLSNYGKFKIIN